MKKRIVSLVLALSFVFASVVTTNAAQYDVPGRVVGTVTTKTPTAISYKDVNRLAEVATTVRGKQARVVNATRYNGNNVVWIARLHFGEGGDQCAADFVLTTIPYSWDKATERVTSLPFKDVAEGTNIYGPCWYYFGLFDDATNQSCGFAIAERIKRWPDFNDLTFSGVTSRGVAYTGSYTSASSESFIEDHIN